MTTKILVIDDEQMFLDALKMVKWDPGLEVTFCNSANEALPLIPLADGIISDVCMANSDKLELALAAVKSRIPIIRMTGNLDSPSKDLLIKPFSLKQFKESINSMHTQGKAA